MGKRSSPEPAASPPADVRYQAPRAYVTAFYGVLAAWVVVCLPFLVRFAARAGWGDLLQLLMVAFVVAFTLYFSLGISYRLEVDSQGEVRFTSFRRTLRLRAGEIEGVEGPPLPLGFARFRLEREKVYLFCIPSAADFQAALAAVARLNPEIKRKRL